MAATSHEVLKLAINNPHGFVGYVHPTEPMRDTDWPAIQECVQRGWLEFHATFRDLPAIYTSESRQHTIWKITETGRNAFHDQGDGK